jgi:hypothetical protein
MAMFKVGDRVVLNPDEGLYWFSEKPFYEVQKVDDDLVYLIDDNGKLVGTTSGSTCLRRT